MPHSYRPHGTALLCEFLISNFRRGLNIVCFLLGNSTASQFYMPTFRNTLVCSIFIGRWIHLPMKMEQIECSKTWAYKIETPGNYPPKKILYSEHGEVLKSRKRHVFLRGFTSNIRHSRFEALQRLYLSGVHKYLRRLTVHGTATYRCDDTRGCIIQFWSPDDEHMVFETCRGVN